MSESRMNVQNALIHRVRGRLGLFLLALIFVVPAGCGDSDPLRGLKLYPVKGKVLLADGKPLTSGSIVFTGVSSTFTSSAVLGSDGSFELKNGAEAGGLPEGEYRIHFETTASKSAGGRGKGTYPFAPRYLDEDGSHLTATVTPDGTKNNFEFKLDAKDLASSSSPARGAH